MAEPPAGSGPELKPKLLSWLVRLLNVPALGGDDESEEDAALGEEPLVAPLSVPAWANPPVWAVAPDGPGRDSAAELFRPRLGCAMGGRKAEGKPFIVGEMASPKCGGVVGGVVVDVDLLVVDVVC
jgi:hypothetical protein